MLPPEIITHIFDLSSPYTKAHILSLVDRYHAQRYKVVRMKLKVLQQMMGMWMFLDLRLAVFCHKLGRLDWYTYHNSPQRVLHFGYLRDEMFLNVWQHAWDHGPFTVEWGDELDEPMADGFYPSTDTSDWERDFEDEEGFHEQRFFGE